MVTRLSPVFGVLGISALFAAVACKDGSAVQRAAPPATSASQTAPAGAMRFALVEKGAAGFLIDARSKKSKVTRGRSAVTLRSTQAIS